jgi:hypothetical protein
VSDGDGNHAGKAAGAALEGVGRISWVGVLLARASLVGRLSHIELEHVGATVAVADGDKVGVHVHPGQTVLTGAGQQHECFGPDELSRVWRTPGLCGRRPASL